VESLSQVPDERGTLRLHDTRQNGRFEVPVPSIRLGVADPGSREFLVTLTRMAFEAGERESLSRWERESRYRSRRGEGFDI
jgi:hypothetical protein